MDEDDSQIGLLSAVSVGIGGMVGGGIFAVLGLAGSIAKGSTFLAFLAASVPAFLTAYSYAKLSVKFPGRGGTVEFLDRAFGRELMTGSLNVLLCLSYVVMLSLYSYAFGSYSSLFLPSELRPWGIHIITSVIIIICCVVNFVGAELVIRSENLINGCKLLILTAFVFMGLGSVEWSQLGPDQWATPFEIVACGMIIFLNYEGFELIANAAAEVEDPKKNIPRAFYLSVAIATLLYILIALVALGHLTVPALEQSSDNALAAAAQTFAGKPGFYLIVVAAMLATASAINASLYGSARMSIILAKEKELPEIMAREVWHKPLGGLLVIGAITLVAANVLDVHTISTMGSAGFLLVFTAVNVANVRLAGATQSRAWISGLAAVSCLLALILLCIQVGSSPHTRHQLWILALMIGASVVIEALTKSGSGRQE